MTHRRVSIQPSARATRRPRSQTASSCHAPRGSELFTPAELRVLRHLPSHLSNSEIAAQLQVATTTVKTQVSSIYRKLGVARRSQAVAVAREFRFLD